MPATPVLNSRLSCSADREHRRHVYFSWFKVVSAPASGRPKAEDSPLSTTRHSAQHGRRADLRKPNLIKPHQHHTMLIFLRVLAAWRPGRVVRRKLLRAAADELKRHATLLAPSAQVFYLVRWHLQGATLEAGPAPRRHCRGVGVLAQGVSASQCFSLDLLQLTASLVLMQIIGRALSFAKRGVLEQRPSRHRSDLVVAVA